jgi:hypothetical protein
MNPEDGSSMSLRNVGICQQGNITPKDHNLIFCLFLTGIKIQLYTNVILSRNNSIGIATGYSLDGQGSIPGSNRDFSLFRRVQTDSGTHPAFYPMGTGGCFPRGRVARE